MSDLFDSFIEGFIAFLMIVMVALLGLLIWALIVTTQDCYDRGGEMVGTGEYTTTTVMVGKVAVPQTTEITECSK